MTISALTHNLAFGGLIRSHRLLWPIPLLVNLLLVYTFHPLSIIAVPSSRKGAAVVVAELVLGVKVKC